MFMLDICWEKSEFCHFDEGLWVEDRAGGVDLAKKEAGIVEWLKKCYFVIIGWHGIVDNSGGIEILENNALFSYISDNSDILLIFWGLFQLWNYFFLLQFKNLALWFEEKVSIVKRYIFFYC